ncbi:hypothetical protein B9S53_14630 [Arthrospira sp. O9.13F]|nr:hypothetical protein B9S53_14630 [Arthrospira sp. O9.13F]
MSPLLQNLLQQVAQLSYEERLELISGVAQSLNSQPHQTSPKRKLSVFRGLVKHPFFGEDAQEWVTRTRREGDEHRERVLRGEL